MLSKIRGVRFQWNEEARKLNPDKVGKTEIGVIAQEIEAVLPEVVKDLETGYKTVIYDRIIALLIQSIKELEARVSKLENK